VAAVPAVLEEAAQDARHALRVEVALELVGEAELPEPVPPGGPVKPGARQVRHQQRHLAPFELFTTL
jgi:hypothetical protein